MVPKKSPPPEAPGGGNRSSEQGQSDHHLRDFSTGSYGGATPTVLFEQGKEIGEVRPDGVFQKRIVGSRDILHRWNALAIGLESLRAAEEAGADRIEITDTETGQVYCCSIRYLRQSGRIFDLGHGDQIRLPLNKWLEPGQERAEQLSLFSDG